MSQRSITTLVSTNLRYSCYLLFLTEYSQLTVENQDFHYCGTPDNQIGTFFLLHFLKGVLRVPRFLQQRNASLDL